MLHAPRAQGGVASCYNKSSAKAFRARKHISYLRLYDDDILLLVSHVRRRVLGDGVLRVRLIRRLVLGGVRRWVRRPGGRRPTCAVYKTDHPSRSIKCAHAKRIPLSANNNIEYLSSSETLRNALYKCSTYLLVSYQTPKTFSRLPPSVKPIFTALHAMQTRSSDENSVRLSVCLSVTRVIPDKMEERSVQIYIPYERTFIPLF